MKQRVVCLAACLCVLLADRLGAQVGPAVTPGFPNVAQTAGAVLSGLNARQQGRTAIIAYHNGVLFTVPEVPASQPGADFQVRTWNIADPRRPVETARLGITPMPVNAHGYFHSGDYLILGANWPPGGEWSFRATAPLTVQRTAFPDLMCAGVRGCLFGPWFIGDTYWSYGEVAGDAELYLDWQLLARWDHLGLTGVIGHPFILGDLLVFASDQSRTGIATYDIGDPTRPQLLDVLSTGGPGGYWPELFAGDGRLYAVFPYNTGGNGFRVVDLTDPTDLRFVADRALPGAASMYVQFQDEFAFLGGHKVDMRTLESVLHLDGENVERPNQPGVFGIDTSQFLLPLGNLLVTGGIGPAEGMAIWAHQSAPDTRGPAVAYHVPQAGRTDYPLGAPISLLVHETLETPTIVNGETFIVRPLGGAALPGRLTFSFDDVLTFMPDQPLLPDTVYEVVVPAGGIKDAAGNGIAGYTFTFSTGASLAGNAPPELTGLSASPYPAAPGAAVTLVAAASDPDGDPLEYRFDFGDGTPKTAWSAQASAGRAYASTGHYRATVQVRDPSGSIASDSRTVTVLVPPAAARPSHSSQLLCDGADRRIWTVNPDSDTVTAVDADGLGVLREVAVCADPRGIARAGDRLWVACHDDDRVRVLDAAGTPIASLPTGYGSAPAGIAAAPDGTTVYVALAGAGALARFHAATLQETGRLALGPGPRAIAVGAGGQRVLVTRFRSPPDRAEIWDVNAATFTLTRTIAVPKFGGDVNADGPASGRGVANYLAAIAIAPDGGSAWIAANKPNGERGRLVGPDLDQDNTVRNLVFEIDLAGNTLARALDIDNSDSASALGFSPLGDFLLVTLQGNDEVVVLDLLAVGASTGLGGFVTRLGTGAAPQAVCTDAATGRTAVNNLLSRDLTVLETDALFRRGEISVAGRSVPTVAQEILAADVLAGKRIFYHASDPRMSAEGYMSCATCHVDGGHDGRVWDFTGRGEGLRNTGTLHGRGGIGHGNVHWTGNFDEIQDFENDVRGAFGGAGFLSDADFAARGAPLGPPKAGRSADLDALAAYVASLDHASLPRSPSRNADGSMTAAALAGAGVFAQLGCGDCHPAPRFTDSSAGASATVHDVGTRRTTSGQRLGAPLTGIDTPTLLGVWDTAPYFHDGSAATLDDVFRIAGGRVLAAESGAVSGGAQVVTQWVEINNDDTVRGRAYVALSGAGHRLTFAGVDGGPGGSGALEVRYSSGYAAFPLTATVNGTPHTVTLGLLGNDPGWRHVNWGRARFENVALNAGASNTIVLSSSSQFPNISVDEIVVSTAADLAAAEPHRRALAVPAADRANLVAYLRQLDGVPAAGPAPPATATPTAAPPATATPTPTAVPGAVSISGRVRYLGSGAAVPGVAVSLAGAVPAGAVTGSGGDYAFAELAAGDFAVGAARIGGTGGAISALDAAWALQATVGLRQLGSAQRMVCDVTGNGQVTALDAARILQRIAGLPAPFPVAQACASDWLFVPAAGAPGGVQPVIGAGLCQPASLRLVGLAAPAAGADFDAAAFGDCTLNGP